MTFAPLDYSDLGGGLGRMLERLHHEGSLTGDLELDAFLRTHPNATLLGLLYDQRVRAEYAFGGPMRLQNRLGHLDMRRIAAMDTDKLRVLFAEKPAVHRFSNKMAETTRAVAQALIDSYDGNTANIWNDDVPFTTIQKRVRQLPGFGVGKAAKIRFVLHYFGYRDMSDTAQ